jgi:hypothetical protein
VVRYSGPRDEAELACFEFVVQRVGRRVLAVNRCYPEFRVQPCHAELEPTGETAALCECGHEATYGRNGRCAAYGCDCRAEHTPPARNGHP